MNFIVDFSQQRMNPAEMKGQLYAAVRKSMLSLETQEVHTNALNDNIIFLTICEDLYPNLPARLHVIHLYNKLVNAFLALDLDTFEELSIEVLSKAVVFQMASLNTSSTQQHSFLLAHLLLLLVRHA